MAGQTKVPMPAARPRIPPTMDSQRIVGTRRAATSCVMPPNRNATPTNVATATRLPTLYDSTNMPNQVHSAPRATIHPQAADASPAPARIVSRSGSGVFRSLVIANFLWLMPPGQVVNHSCPRRRECCKEDWGFLTTSPTEGLRVVCGLGELVGVGAGVDGVEDGQLRVLDRPVGEVEGFGRVSFCPVRVVGGDLGVHVAGPLVDVCLDVAHLVRGVSLQLRPLRPSAVGGLRDLLPC